MIRDHRYKLIHYYGDEDQLFDLQNDPLEQINLLYYHREDPEVRVVLDRLYPILRRYEEKWGIEGHMKNGEFVEFAPFAIRSYFESCYPKQIQKLRGEENDYDELADEILSAIRDEPTVHLSRLHVRDNLTRFGGYSDAYVDVLLERAKAEGRY